LQQEREEQLKRRARNNSKKSQFNADNNRWEENRMLGSGVAVRMQVDTDFDDDQEARIPIMVHDIKPPFLDGYGAR
jgi:pre-mRNA-splicing factor ATP-dependent RNA helicase DHX38/PRP16